MTIDHPRTLRSRIDRRDGAHRFAKIAGRMRGGGSELVLSLEMRFGALGRAVLGQPEVALAVPDARARMERFLAAGGQTAAVETGDLRPLLERLGRS